MKSIVTAFVLALGLGAQANACSIYITQDEVGPGKTFSEADIQAFAKKGYSIQSQGAVDDGVMYIQSGSTCQSWILFQSCSYMLSLGRNNGGYGGISFSQPVTASSISKAIAQLPSCN